MSDATRILVTGASRVGRSALIALLSEKLNDRRIEFVDESDMPENNQALIELSSYPVRDLDVSHHCCPTLRPHARQSKGERKRNKRNRWN